MTALFGKRENYDFFIKLLKETTVAPMRKSITVKAMKKTVARSLEVKLDIRELELEEGNKSRAARIKITLVIIVT